MKKIYLTLAAAALGLTAVAQQAAPQMRNASAKVVDIASLKQRGPVNNPKSGNAITNFWLDYSVANFDDAAYVWRFNSNYGATDTAVSYIAVAVTGPLWGYTDAADPANTIESYDYYFNPITIDSVFAAVSHENNSGTYNKIYYDIVTLNASGTPTSTALWTAVDSSNVTLSPGGNYVGQGAGVQLAYAPAFTTTNGQKIGLSLRYIGDKLDTFAVSAGYVDNGSGGADDPSQFATSFMKFPPFINSIAPNSSIGYGNPVGADGWFEAQNWWLWAYVTYNVTSITENQWIKGVKIGQSFPNPADKQTRFFYELQKPTNVSFDVYDVNGRLVKNYNEGIKEAGKHTHIIDLASFTSGVYFYTIKTDATTITKRFVVTK